MLRPDIDIALRSGFVTIYENEDDNGMANSFG